jgi:hypothetical protein
VFPVKYVMNVYIFRTNPVARAFNPVWRRVEYLHRSPCESQEATQREHSAWRYNWATIFPGDINTGTWPSKLWESQMRQ